MEIILHIGLHKTGSTSIQNYFFENRNLILKHYGFLYPETGIFTVAHHFAAWSLQEPLESSWAISLGFDKKAKDLFPEIINEAMSAGARKLLISSEDFSLISPEKLAPIIKNNKLMVFLYLRRQDKLIESFFGQMVRQYETRYYEIFDTYLASLGNFLDFEIFLDNWQQAIPGVVIKPMIYDRSEFPNGNVVEDFLKAIGLDIHTDIDVEKSIVNESLSPLSIRALAKINKMYSLDRDQHEGLIIQLRGMPSDDDLEQVGFFSFERRIAYLENYEKSNQIISKRFFGHKNALAIPTSEIRHFLTQDAKADPSKIERAVQMRIKNAEDWIAKSIELS